jgi:hypothetical protein
MEHGAASEVLYVHVDYVLIQKDEAVNWRTGFAIRMSVGQARSC